MQNPKWRKDYRGKKESAKGGARMSRLTSKDDDNVYRISGFTTIDELIDKLAIYEDLEESISCPLEVYVRATIEGIKVDGSIYKVKVRKDNYGYYFALSNGSAFPFYLSSYKKTWWLKEDKSE